MTLPKGWKKESSSTEYDKKIPSRDEPPTDGGYAADATLGQDEVKDFWGRKVIDARYITTTKIARNGKWIGHELVEDILVTNVSATYKSYSAKRGFSGNSDDLRFTDSKTEGVSADRRRRFHLSGHALHHV